MRRILGWSLLLGLIALGLLWPLAFGSGSAAGPADDPVVITDYRADFTVGADGDLTAVETITGDFPSGRHGIFRYWDVANPNEPSVRQTPEITSILLDGEPVDYQMLWEDADRFRVAKIGDPYSTLWPGAHTYEIRYAIDGVLDPGSTGSDRRFATDVGRPDSESAFFWNVVAPSWNNEIERVRIRATMPGDVTGARCAVGFGVGRPCTGLTLDGDTVEFSATDLPPRTPVTLRAGVDVPTPQRVELPWSQPWDRVFGQSVVTAAWVLGIAVAAGAAGYLWYRTTVEPVPGSPVQYEPPPGLGPVQTEYVRTERVPWNGLTATLFHLAERNLVELRQVSNAQWNVRGIAERKDWIDVDPVGVAVGSTLKVMGRGTVFEARKSAKAGAKLQKAKTEMAEAVRKWARDEGLIVPRRKELWIRSANAVAAILALCGFFRWGFPTTMWGLPFAAFFALTVGAWAAGVGTRRTEAGRQLWSRAEGFHRLLSTDSAETRFDFAARKDLYTAYVPYAVAAGSAAAWARKYETTMGTVAPQPVWYQSSSSSGDGDSSIGSGGGADFDGFESALSSSIGAYTASQVSSSSGSSSGSSSSSSSG
ncbi:MAG: DUF2207 domain-containing protein, partial [Mycolicibacterium sp.]|nr:DUF2207 domain-containing protein [Mycolicibacterium sp.]